MLEFLKISFFKIDHSSKPVEVFQRMENRLDDQLQDIAICRTIRSNYRQIYHQGMPVRLDSI